MLGGTLAPYGTLAPNSATFGFIIVAFLFIYFLKAHQKTYARVPKLRKKKKNIYLANLGLDDDDDEEEEEDPAGSDEGQELSSDSETDEAKRKKNKKQRKAKRKPVPVEQVIHLISKKMKKGTCGNILNLYAFF